MKSYKKQIKKSKKSRHHRKGKKYSRVNKKSMRGGTFYFDKIVAKLGEHIMSSEKEDLQSLSSNKNILIIYFQDINENGLCETLIDKNETRYIQLPSMNQSKQLFETQLLNSGIHSHSYNYRGYITLTVSDRFISQVIENDDLQKTLKGQYLNNQPIDTERIRSVFM